jgi:hypothetical protein
MSTIDDPDFYFCRLKLENGGLQIATQLDVDSIAPRFRQRGSSLIARGRLGKTGRDPD